MERVKIDELWVKNVKREDDDLEVVLTTKRDEACEVASDDLFLLYKKFEGSLQVISIQIKETDITEMRWMSF